jgi:V8-like Glu-specific endopeptidase
MSDVTARPLAPAEVLRRFTEAPARSDRLLAIEQRFFVAGGASPPRFEVVVHVDGVRVGTRAMPRPLAGKGFGTRDLAFDPRRAAALLAAFQPDHLARRPVPRELVRPRQTIFPADDKRIRRPTTVFSPDDRRLFQDTAYPWSTVGRVETARGWGSGVMIGPRHLLTVSHIIDWDVPAPFAAGWVKFTPSYFDGSEPFGHAFSTNIYWRLKEDGDNTISTEEAKGDFVVVVLESRIGETTGWMGARSYTDSWDGLNVWSHMGYPGDLNSGQRPSFQGGFPLDGAADEPDSGEAIFHGRPGLRLVAGRGRTARGGGAVLAEQRQ